MSDLTLPEHRFQSLLSEPLDLSRYSTLLFDLDGTVLDTKDLILASFHYACDRVMGCRLPDEQLLELVGIPLTEQMARLAPDCADELVVEYREHNAMAHEQYIKCFPSMPETIQFFYDAGWPLCIVTSKLGSSARQGLDSFDLTKYFRFVVGSDETERHKPDPEPLLFAANLMGAEPTECIYIGDSPYDMQAARAAGMLAVGAAWGMFQPETLIEAGAQLLVYDNAALPEVLS